MSFGFLTPIFVQLTLYCASSFENNGCTNIPTRCRNGNNCENSTKVRLNQFFKFTKIILKNQRKSLPDLQIGLAHRTRLQETHASFSPGIVDKKPRRTAPTNASILLKMYCSTTTYIPIILSNQQKRKLLSRIKMCNYLHHQIQIDIVIFRLLNLMLYF